MQIGTKFSVAIHILLSVEIFRETNKVTSDFIASSVNTNPVVIRKIMSLLRDAGIVEIAPGTGGIRLTRSPGDISLLDVYRATEPVKGEGLFKIHENPAAACPVGGNIAELLRGPLLSAQKAMETDLGLTSIGSLLENLKKIRKKNKLA